MKRYKALAAFLIMASIALWVSNDDYKIAKAEAEQYCQHVKDGSHPNFKNIECE